MKLTILDGNTEVREFEEVLFMTYYLSALGADDSDGRSPETAWRTLERANAAVKPGDTVLLRRGDGQYGHGEHKRRLSAGLRQGLSAEEVFSGRTGKAVGFL